MDGDFKEKREFPRVEYESSLIFKVLSGDRLVARPDICSRNVSAGGLLFRTSTESSIPAISRIVWTELDAKLRDVCSVISNDLVTHKAGILGKVVRIAEGEPGRSYDVGVSFLRKKNPPEEEVLALLKN